MPELPYRVRPMEPEDISTIVHLDRLAFPTPWPSSAYKYELTQNSHAHYYVVEEVAIPEEEPANPREGSLRERFRQILAGDKLRPHILGFGGFWLIQGEAHIATLAVHPDHRRRGLGELLLATMLQEARHRQGTLATLEVRVSNSIAQNLYRKYGFQTVGRRRHYYVDNREDALLMTLAGLDTPEYGALLEKLEEAIQQKLLQEAETNPEG